NAAGITTAGTIAQLGFSTPQPVSTISIEPLTASQPLGAVMQFEIFTDAWVPFGAPFSVETSGYVIRSAAAAPGAPVTAISVRLQLLSAPPSATDFGFSHEGFRASRESSAASFSRLKPFTFSNSQTYVAIFTNSQVDFYRDGVFV